MFILYPKKVDSVPPSPINATSFLEDKGLWLWTWPSASGPDYLLLLNDSQF